MTPVSLLLLSLFGIVAWRAEASQADPAPSENETGCGLGFGEQVTWDGRSDNYVACNMTTASGYELGICRADGKGHSNFENCFAEPETKCEDSLWFIKCSDLNSEASTSDDEDDNGLIIAIIIVAVVLAILACVAALACRKKPEEEQKAEEMVVEEGNVAPPPAVTEEKEEAPVSSAPPVEEPAPVEAAPVEYEWKGDQQGGKGSDDIEVHWQGVTMHAVEPPPMDAD